MENGEWRTIGSQMRWFEKVILAVFVALVLALALFFGLPVGIHNWCIVRAYWGL